MSITVASKLGLGTASFGLDYGIVNKRGKVPQNEVFKILDYCQDVGIDLFDTAFVYGDSEEIIGKWKRQTSWEFKIVSKLPHWGEFAVDDVEELLSKTLKRLNSPGIYGYLIHKFEDFLNYKGLWGALKDFKERGLVKKIGFSIYRPDELEILFDKKLHFDIIQIPYSIFDRRFGGFLKLLKENDVEIHARSIYLQGIVFVDPQKDLTGNLVKARPYIERIRELATREDIPVDALCLNFVLSNPYLDRVIIGVDNLGHLKSNIRHMKLMGKVQGLSGRLSELRIEDEDILLPYKWGQ